MDGKGFIWALLLEQNQTKQITGWCFAPMKEYMFLPDRKFKFDFAFYYGTQKWAVEYEGIYAAKSRHTQSKGYSTDCTKYNLATINGWRVLRYTAANYRQFQDDLKTILISAL